MSSKANWINKYFTGDQLKDIQSAIDRAERSTVGEIILSLHEKRSWLEKLYTQHEFAMKDFRKLGVANTKDRAGVMIFIIFDEHYYDIIADEGLFVKISDDKWNEMEEALKKDFQAGDYFTGLLALIIKMEEILCKEFPCRADSQNDDEISDEIKIN